MRSNEMAVHNSPALNTETTISLSQSMDSVNTTPEEEVRTLFVSGLPMDAKPRELYLLFRAYKGYQNALLKVMGKPGKNCGYEGSLLKVTNKNGKNTSPVGFVTFTSRVEAETAKQDLQGVRFDPDLPQTLRLEFAKSNTKVTKPKQQSPQPAATHPTIIHPLTGQSVYFPSLYGKPNHCQNSQSFWPYGCQQELGAAAFFPGSHEAWAPHPLAAYPELAPAATAIHHAALIQHPALAQGCSMLVYPAAEDQKRQQNQFLTAWHPGEIHPTAMVPHPATVPAGVPHPQIAATPILTSPVGANSTTASQPNAPCSTLFVANLGQFSSEQELKDLFSSFPGFCRLRMHNKGGSPVAFVEFQDVRQATDAMNRLHGFVLLSSDRGGIRIEYAKNKMGEVNRKEETPTGQSPIQTAAY